MLKYEILIGVFTALLLLVCGLRAESLPKAKPRAAAAAAGADRPAKLRVLLLSGRNNHDWRQTTPALVKILQQSGRFAVTVTNETEKLKASDFRTCDVIVSNWTPWPNIRKRFWSAETEKAFLDFIRGGGGLVVFHASSTAFATWPEFQQLVGATWGKGTGHGRRHEFEVKIASPSHPVTAGMKNFRIFDELWHRMLSHPGGKVLCTAFSAKKNGGTGKDEPVAMCTHLGKGRGFNLVLGHDTRAMSFPGWQALMLRGTQWAATGKVTIAAPAAAAPAPQKPKLSWKKTDTSLSLLDHDRVVWRLNFDKKEGKPYFHPLTLAGGNELTSLRPADHVWHRAVWFSWKYIDGLNYWEENRKTGLSQGRTEITKVAATANKDNSAKIEMALSYHPPDKAAVLTEKRVTTVSAPDKNGQYHIDWRSTFTAGATDAVLDRTPLPGEKGGRGYGGYAGLSLRMAKSTRKWTFLSSEHLAGQKAHGKKARWVDFSGDTCGVAVFDHPANMRHPQPWYVAPGMPYFGPALLFDKAYTLAAGKSFSLRYRILIHPGRGDKKKLEKQWQAFSKSEGR